MSRTDERTVGQSVDLSPRISTPSPIGTGHRRPITTVRRDVVRARLTRTRYVVGEASVAATRAVFGGGLLKTFALFVLLPTIAVGIYVCFLASRQFVAETRFVVRGNVERASGGSGLPIGGLSAVGTQSTQDSYVVSEYIRSSEMVDRLATKVDLAGIYDSPTIDFWARFRREGPRENLVDYWHSMSRVSVENLSGIVSVKVWTFSPADSLKISAEILQASEELTNRLTQRGRDDLMSFSRTEVARAEERVKETLKRLAEFKNASSLVDPTKQVEDALGVLTLLNKTRIDLDVQLQSVARTLRPDSPVVRELKAKKQSTEAQIAELEGRLTSSQGGNGGSRGGRPIVSEALTEYEQVEVDKLFAEKAYETAQLALDAARKHAEAQQVYISVFSPPSLPEEAIYPRRLTSIFSTFVIALAIWSIVALLAATVKDHRI